MGSRRTRLAYRHGFVGVGLAVHLLLAACGSDGALPDSEGSETAPVMGASSRDGSAGTEDGGTAGEGGSLPWSPMDGGRSPLAACMHYMDALCQRLDQCGALPSFCAQPERYRQCPDVFFSEGTLTTPEDLWSCANDVLRIACTDIDTDRALPPCRTAGRAPDGAPCVASSQCASFKCSGRLAAEDGVDVCGVCQSTSGPRFAELESEPELKRPAALGEPCHYVYSECEPAAFCNLDAKVCAPRRQLGEACESYPVEECVLDAYCDAGICVPRKELGARCGTFDGACALSLDCVDDDRSPTDRCVLWVGEGQACDQNHLCEHQYLRCEAGICTYETPAEESRFTKACAPL